MKRFITLIIAAVLVLSLVACGGAATPAPTAEPVPTPEAVPEATPEATPEVTPEPVPEPAPQPAVPALEDGSYTVEFDTDSSMFHLNESCMGKAILVVQDGAMTVHLTLPSKNIVNLFPGLVADVEANPDMVLQPTVDSVTYSDGMTEKVYGFDVPVPVLEDEFDLALVGTKGNWYDHKVTVSNPEPMEQLP